MSIGRRFWRVARAELRGAFRRDRRTDYAGLEQELSQMRSSDQQETYDPPKGDEPAEVRAWYANLELPIGASADEVKAAYRRLMRDYHPDRHMDSDDHARAAHELAQKLTEARDGLLAYLGA